MRTFCAFLLGLWAWVGAAWGQVQYPARMYADSIHWPFELGVCSGDPRPDGVLLWTRVSGASGTEALTCTVATDSGMQQVAQSLPVAALQAQDWTVQVDVGGLQAGTRYFYRFTDSQGRHSAVGRTRTAAVQASGLNVAVFSCSSIYSGFFNAYARVAQRPEVDLCVHLGDYIYEAPDPDELVRMPTPAPTKPQDLSGWRERHRYYLLDPDLREARRLHPWAVMWDNHDVNTNDGVPMDTAAMRAFREYVPMRVQDAAQPNVLYRSLGFGNLMSLHLLDILLYRAQDTFAHGAYNLLGDAQLAWAQQSLGSSPARWKLLGSQKMMGGWYTRDIDPFILQLVPNAGPVFDAGSWDGFMATRDTLLGFMRTQGMDNVLALSGDAHMTFGMDLVEDPFDSLAYDGLRGTGAAGAEFLPTSVSRGNFDESGVPVPLADAFIDISKGSNPHHVVSEFVQHGYGLLRIRPDSLVAEVWYVPILSVSGSEVLGQRLVMYAGENHWRRPGAATGAGVPLAGAGYALVPNPATAQCVVRGPGRRAVRVSDALGRDLHAGYTNSVLGTGAWPPGLYLVRVEGCAGGLWLRKE